MKHELDRLADALIADRIYHQPLFSALYNSTLYDIYRSSGGFENLFKPEWISELSEEDITTFVLLILESENYWGDE